MAVLTPVYQKKEFILFLLTKNKPKVEICIWNFILKRNIVILRRSEIEGKIDISVISSINNKINSRMQLPELLSSIMDTAKEILNAEGASLLLTDFKTGDLIFNIVIGEKGEVILGEKVPRGKGIAGTVAETGEPVIVNNVQKDPRFFSEIDKISDFTTITLLGLPMIVMEELIGVLEVVNSRNKNGFTQHDLEIAAYLANQAAIAIDNRRLYDELERRIDELTALYDISQAVSFENKDLGLILDRIVNSLVQSLMVRRASISMVDDSENTLSLTAFYGLPNHLRPGYRIDLEGTISGHVYKNMDPMIVSDIKCEIPEEMQKNTGAYSTNSFISIPILHNNKPVGVLSLADKLNGQHFDSFDLRVLSTVSNLIAEAAQSIKNQKNMEAQKQLEREIKIAADIQKKILPDIPGEFKNHRLASYNRPARVVGGDFFDFFIFDENKYSALVADVSGKGIPAAMFMGLARNIVRAETRINISPAPLLKNVNRYICRDSESSMFVTLFYAIIDSHNSIITYGSAGHNNQLLIKNRTREAVTLNSKGRPLGIFEDIEFEEKVVMYEKDDMLVLFTDGLIESLAGEGLDIDEGQERLIKIAIDHADSQPAELIEALKNLPAEKKSEKNHRDDLTVLVIKF